MNDIIKDEFYKSIILDELQNNSNLGDEYDYRVELKKLSIVFEEHNLNLFEIMSNSISNNSLNTESDLAIFNSIMFELSIGNYIHSFDIFYPAMNEDIYPNVDLNLQLSVGTSLYNLHDDFSILIFNDSEHTFEQSSHETIDENPILLISANIISIDENIVNINTAPLLAAGRCKKSNSTGWCNHTGRGCKCQGGPVERIEAIDNFKNLINHN